MQLPKKVRSEKQIETTNKLMAMMKEKREANKKTQEQEAEKPLEVEGLKKPRKPYTKKEKVAVAPAPAEAAKAAAPAPQVPEPLKTEYLTKASLDDFKRELLGAMPPKTVEKPVYVEKEKIVHLSGNALLDKIFFGK